MENRVQEVRLPGTGMRDDIDLGGDRSLFAGIESSGSRHLGFMRRDDATYAHRPFDHAVIAARSTATHDLATYVRGSAVATDHETTR